MKLNIVHETLYQFDSAVFLEPHYLHFKPLTTPNSQLESFSIEVLPKPAGLSQQLDAENNLTHLCWFDGLHQKLSIKARSVVNSSPYNPFDFLVYPDEYLTIPFNYSPSLEVLLKPSLGALELTPQLINYAQQVLNKTSNNTTQFIMQLTQQIHQDFSAEVREYGSPLNPEETFELKKASCRDLTWMQIQLLRQLSIAARFVSGYYYLDAVNPEFELHAWLEAYLPGTGWVGYDPTHGVMVEHTHIPVAVSSHFENTMPVSGTIRGSSSSQLESRLIIERLTR